MPVKKKVPARVQYKDYAAYLKSPKWKQVKEDYKKNESIDNCLCCESNFLDSDLTINFHHFKYSKDWNNDTWENLIIVCSKCHNHLHSCNYHDSDPRSLRDYILAIVNSVKDIYARDMWDKKQDARDEQLENRILGAIWEQSGGRFSIQQQGMSRHKEMQVELHTEDQALIAHFEERRDEILHVEDGK